MLSVQNLIKNYKKTNAVNDISFNIKAGEIVGLLGPNGAGKSTTIKTICGLLRKTSGSIKIADFDHLTDDAKRSFAYIPEMPDLYDYLTPWEHFKFIAYAYGIKDWEDEALHYMVRYDLMDKKEVTCKELSKGMKQKVSIICALIIKPQMFLFDEPMIGLDPKAIRETKVIFNELSEQGKAVFVSTHLLDTIDDLCHRVLVMNKGQIVAEGSVNDLSIHLSDDRDITLEEIYLEVTKSA